jgi:hypothetical protein
MPLQPLKYRGFNGIAVKRRPAAPREALPLARPGKERQSESRVGQATVECTPGITRCVFVCIFLTVSIFILPRNRRYRREFWRGLPF